MRIPMGRFLSLLQPDAALVTEIVISLTLSDFGGPGRFRRYSRFHQEWTTNAQMPNVIFLEPEYTDGPHANPNDDHPPTGAAKGQEFLADIYNTLVSNPARWQKTMMIAIYDEHGGFFDHVPPLPIPTDVAGLHFTTAGVRVPAFVLSPQVAPGTVFSANLDHTSMLQLLADRFNPTGGYSAAVGARQPQLGSLAQVLLATPPAVTRAPAIPRHRSQSKQASPTHRLRASAPAHPARQRTREDCTTSRSRSHGTIPNYWISQAGSHSRGMSLLRKVDCELRISRP